MRTVILLFFQFACCVSHTYCFWHQVGKMSPPPQHTSALVYSFRCICGLQYIGRTNQWFDGRIKQHVPPKVRLGNYFADHINNTYGSSIAEHLINNRDCASPNNADLFYILSRSHSDFHVKVSETIHILIHKPSLCMQGNVYWVLIWLQFNNLLPVIFSNITEYVSSLGFLIVDLV